MSKDLVAADIARRLVGEGHTVRLHIENKNCREPFDNIVDKSKNWKHDLKWVGKDGLIVFDDTGSGAIQDRLREKGYAVVGGSEVGEKLELDREYGQRIFKSYGLKTYPLKDFYLLEDAILYAQKNRKAWVVKQNGYETKMLNYVAEFTDGRDVIDVLKNHLQNKALLRKKITLHQRIDGIEIGVGRYFNGKDWVGPIEHNIEHPKFFPDNLGPMTSEMGTVAWYTNKETKLYKETLAKIKPFLIQSGFKGDASLNCIVNESGAHILEATMRMGSPICHLQTELQITPWGEILNSLARGTQCKIEYKKGVGIVVLLAVPPFPYTREIKGNLFHGIHVYLSALSEEERNHVHFEGIAKRTGTEDQHFIASNDGYIMYVTGHGKSVKAAQKMAYGIIKKIVIPKVMYRNDIGTKFAQEDYPQLKEWGWI